MSQLSAQVHRVGALRWPDWRGCATLPQVARSATGPKRAMCKPTSYALSSCVQKAGVSLASTACALQRIVRTVAKGRCDARAPGPGARGACLCDAGCRRCSAALREFEAVLERDPNRLRAFAGASRAVQGTGDHKKATVYATKLVEHTKTADTQLREVARTAITRTIVREHDPHI